MQEDLDASTVIGHIYEASYRPSFWSTALESIARFTHSSSVALIYQDDEMEQVSDLHTYNISEAVSAKHKSLGIDPNFQIMSENVPLGKAAAIDHIIQDRKKLESIYGEKFNKLLAEADMYYIGGAVLFMDNNRAAGFSVDAQLNSFDADTVETGFTGGLYKNGSTTLTNAAIEGGYMINNTIEVVAGYQTQDADGYLTSWDRTSVGANWFIQKHDI